MINVFSKILELTRAGLLDKPLSTDICSADWEQILKIAEQQNLISIMYRAVRISNITIPDEVLIRLRTGFFQDVRTDRLQNSELTALFQAFDENGIDYFPIKGIEMKKYYPGSVYRWMSDADIFIRPDQYDRIAEIMSRAGYSFVNETEHEFQWRKSGFLIELHKQAMSSAYENVVDYFGDGFTRAHRIGDSHRYQFDKTDELIYAYAHFVKHYLTGGAKLRNIIDLYYLWIRGGEDKAKLETVLKSFDLFTFYDILKKTVMAWLNGAPLDAQGELIFQTVLSDSNEYKSSRKFIFWEARSNRGKTKTPGMARVRTMLRSFFIPNKKIHTRFRIFRKLPFLLPFFWIWRGIYTILFRKERLKEYVNVQFKGSEEYLEKYMKEMKTLGLDRAVVPEPSCQKDDKHMTKKCRLLTPREQVLLKALVGDASFRESVKLLTDNMDADKENSLYLLSLGIIGFHEGWQYFPNDLIPRIRGIHRYYQVENSAAAPWLRERLAVLEQEKIPFILTGGTAVRAYYAADTPRMMNGYDITVKSEDYEKAAELLRNSIRNNDANSPFERTINGRTVIKLHKGVPDSRIFDEESFWSHAEPAEYLDHQVLVPSASDMLLHLLCLPYAPWIYDEDHTDRVRRLAESCIVARHGVSYKAVAEAAKKAGLIDVVHFYLELLSWLVPNTIFPKDWEEFFPNNNAYRQFVRKLDMLGHIHPGKKRRDFFLRLARRTVRMHITKGASKYEQNKGNRLFSGGRSKIRKAGSGRRFFFSDNRAGKNH